MTTANGPQHLPAQAAPEQGRSAEEGVVFLPPVPSPTAQSATAPRRVQHGWDGFLAFLVLVLGFLTASFLAGNSDLWFHLATGRLLARGQFSFGKDPFAYTTGQVYWANHAWLFDLGLYGLYRLVGGAGLVVLKALLVTALAGVLLRVRRPAGAAWVPAICTTLALLAMSPRLLLQPACVSYFLLGLTFWLLWKPHWGEGVGTKESGPYSPLRTPFSLLALFALWVNVDEWFLLGPLLAALFWVGERLQGQRLTPAWVVPAGLAACLLNPHTFHAFTLPPELSAVPWTSGLRQDVHFQALFASPWQPAYLHAAAGLNAAALAYFALTALGLLSFLGHRQALRGWRLVVWLPFALLAAWQARAIPFYVVVAAPITVLNWQDLLAARRETVPRASEVRRGPRAGRLVLALALLALIFLNWPGWLAGYGREGRRVAWGLQVEPSLQRAAEMLHDWRRQGLLPKDERVFAFSPEVAQYGAWFCPGERHFFDHRYHLFPDAAREYETVCQALQTGGEDATEWQQVLREHRVGIVVLYDREPQRVLAALPGLASDPEHWTLLHVAGQALIVGWNKARLPGDFAPLAFDADRLAFGPQDEREERELPAAPGLGPERLPPRRDFWARLTRPAAPSSWESPAATVYLHYFHDSEAGQRRQQLRASFSACAASLAGLPAQPSGVPLVALQLVASRSLLGPRDTASSFLVRDQLGPFFRHLVDRPPALPLLAVRAARRAVAANPEDSNAWLRLGQAYQLLRDFTCERSSVGLLPPLAQLRHVQIATALEQAVRLDPDLEAAHHELAHLYGEQNYLDQALVHVREEVRLSRRAGRRAGETAEDSAHRLELLERDIFKLEELVAEQRKKYASGSPALQGERLPQARMALGLGLARQAADDILLPFPADLLGSAGIKLELELLLTLGRTEDVRGILNDEGVQAGHDQFPYHDIPAPNNLEGTALYPVPYHWPGYEWLHVLQAAAIGDYVQARGDLHAIRSGLRVGHDRLVRQLREFERGERELLPGLLAGPPAFLPGFTAQTLGRLLGDKAALQDGERILRAHQADLCVLEALLALEQGATTEAWSAFVEAQQVCAQPPGAPVSFAGGPIAGGYLRKLNGKEWPGGF